MNVTVIFDQGEQHTFALQEGSLTEHLKYQIYVDDASPRKGTLPNNQVIYTSVYTYGDKDALTDGATYYFRRQSDPIPIPGATGTRTSPTANQNRTISVIVKFQSGTELTWTMEEQDDVADLKQKVSDEQASPMRGREPAAMRIVRQSQELANNVKLVDGATYYPVLRLGGATDESDDELMFEMD
jgi:hypothetical protein